MIEGFYYCIQINYVSATTSISSSATATGTAVATPTPTQTGISSDCDDFYLVQTNDTCYDIAAGDEISLDDFYDWNPAVGTDCSDLEADYYVCIGVSSNGTSTASATSTSPASTTTSIPTQTGIASNCDDLYLVQSGDTCYDIAAADGISLDDFYAWNPAVGTDCDALDVGYYVCVGVSSTTSTTTTTAISTIAASTTTVSTTLATTTVTTATSSAPSPSQTGLDSSCDDYHLVVSGDGCYDIAAAAGISLDDFYDWNPAVGDDCSGLWTGYYVCIGVS